MLFRILIGLSRSEPDNPDASFQKGIACIRMSRYDEALVSFSQTLARKKDHPPSLYYRGIALTKAWQAQRSD